MSLPVSKYAGINPFKIRLLNDIWVVGMENAATSVRSENEGGQAIIFGFQDPPT